MIESKRLKKVLDFPHYHMEICRKTMLILGIWPVNRNRDWIEIAYETYFLFTFFYFLIFNMSGIVFAILTWSQNYLITASTMGIVIEYLSCAYKISIFKSKVFKSLIHELHEKEQEILESGDEAIIKIYKNNEASNRKIIKFYSIMGTTGISFYFITPLISNVILPLGVDNTTGVLNHYFIVFNWFPFDPNQYYAEAYLIQFFGCLIGYSYIVHCGAFYISLLTFIVSWIQIVQHFFANLINYAEQYRVNYKLTTDQSRFVLIRLLVKEHLKIIRFVQTVNKAIRTFTLMNFVISSFQLSLVAYQIFKLPPLHQVTVFSYFITLSVQLFLTYRTAHGIMIESTNIASSIYEEHWDEYSPNICKLLQMICVRAQKPLPLTVGRFANMEVSAVIQIFKLLYSYICIIMKN